MVAPRAHREEATSDFELEEYLELQAVVHRIGEAIRAVVPTESPLPPGVPFDQQQFAALDRSDRLDLSEAELAGLAERLRTALGRQAGV